ncbi:MAG TPA: hypothetical protein VFQ45_17260 [Longimicrobium sp.]|nr:hypothetical protein [Longimicrobium sp.]
MAIHDEELEALLHPAAPDDLPELERLGIFTGTVIDWEPEFAEFAAKLRGLAGAPEPYVDDEGAEWQVVAHVVDDAARRAAWVEWRWKEGRVVDTHYRLKARDDRSLVVRWEVATYNPYFGCRVKHLGWVGDAVVMVYEDKHDTYAAAAGRGLPIRRSLISPDWALDGATLAWRDADGRTHRIALPLGLDPL